MTVDMENRLRKTQRQMLRIMLRTPRRRDQQTDPDAQPRNSDGLEPWVDYIRRSTKKGEEALERLHIDDWISIQRRRKWRWAKRVCSSEAHEWTLQALRWDPQQDPTCGARRRPGRPKRRWCDDIRQHAGPNWMSIANTDMWEVLEPSYVGRSAPESSL